MHISMLSMCLYIFVHVAHEHSSRHTPRTSCTIRNVMIFRASSKINGNRTPRVNARDRENEHGFSGDRIGVGAMLSMTHACVASVDGKGKPFH